MSHMVQIDLQIDDLDALDAACDKLGLELRRDKTRFAWYGQFLGDSAGLAAEGVPPDQYPLCAHTIGRKGTIPNDSTGPYHVGNDVNAEYEIGLVALPEGGYKLRFDYWGPGQWIAQLAGGNALDKLAEEYGYAVAENQFHMDGYETRREVVDGHLDIVAFK